MSSPKNLEQVRFHQIMVEIMDQLRLLVIAKKIEIKKKYGIELNAMEHEFLEN